MPVSAGVALDCPSPNSEPSKYTEAEGTGSRSAALCGILDEYVELRTNYDESRTECKKLRTRINDREARVQELRGTVHPAVTG